MCATADSIPICTWSFSMALTTSRGADLGWLALGHLKTSEGGVLERAVRRMEKHLRRRGRLVEDDGTDADAESGGDPESNLAARRPPALGEGIRKRVESLRRSSPRFRVPHRCILKSVERLVATAVSSSSATDETDH
jgi:hypothetical protein